MDQIGCCFRVLSIQRIGVDQEVQDRGKNRKRCCIGRYLDPRKERMAENQRNSKVADMSIFEGACCVSRIFTKCLAATKDQRLTSKIKEEKKNLLVANKYNQGLVCNARLVYHLEDFSEPPINIADRIEITVGVLVFGDKTIIRPVLLNPEIRGHAPRVMSGAGEMGQEKPFLILHRIIDCISQVRQHFLFGIPTPQLDETIESKGLDLGFSPKVIYLLHPFVEVLRLWSLNVLLHDRLDESHFPI
jgi:hypothetical protein